MGVRHDGSWVKQERMNRISHYILNQFKASNRINLNKLRAWVEINIGLTPRRAEEYIATISLAYDWLIKDGLLIKPETTGLV